MAKIRVEDEDDVDRVLDRYGIDGHGDIRRANGSYRRRIAATDDAERLDLHAGGSADRFAANIAALHGARAVVTEQLDALARTLERARGLGGRMNDGHGPIAAAMSTTFRQRARSADGVVVALTNYHTELADVLVAIDSTIAGYEATELAAKRGLAGQGDA